MCLLRDDVRELVRPEQFSTSDSEGVGDIGELTVVI